MKKVWIFIVVALFLAAPAAAQEAQWAPSGSLMLGKFNSEGLASDILLELAGYEMAITGRSWDLGVTRGQPGKSYWRLAYSQVAMDDGSKVFDEEDFIGQNLRLRGVKAEKVWRVGPSGWKIAPMISLHGGIGHVSGQVIRQSTISTPADSSIKEMFESNWLPIFGGGAGVMISTRRTTVTISAFGGETFGPYKGQLQLTFWR